MAMQEIFPDTLDGDLDEDSKVEASGQMRGCFNNAEDALRFMRGGNAVFTLESTKTGARFTYKLRTSEDKRMRFLSVLNGPDNYANYQYLGNVKIGQEVLWHGRKSKISQDAPSYRAIDWAWRWLAKGKLPDQLAIWHEGKCGRCGRRLTVPQSIEQGFGPECINKIFE